MREEEDYCPHEGLVNIICLGLFGYAPEIHANSQSSVYIKFNNLPNNLTHKLRISDRDERDEYGYKWQLRIDGVENVGKKKEWSRYFDDPDKLIAAFKAYYDKVEESPRTWGQGD